MFKYINYSMIAALVFVLTLPAAYATSEIKDGYYWNHGYSSNCVYSNYDNNQPHSASVEANGTGVYKVSTNKSNYRIGVALNTNNGGKKAYYNYW